MLNLYISDCHKAIVLSFACLTVSRTVRTSWFLFSPISPTQAAADRILAWALTTGRILHLTLLQVSLEINQPPVFNHSLTVSTHQPHTKKLLLLSGWLRRNHPDPNWWHLTLRHAHKSSLINTLIHFYIYLYFHTLYGFTNKRKSNVVVSFISNV